MTVQRFTLITGASGGIGEAIARVAARNRRDLILVARSEDKLQALADELSAEHTVDVVVVPADLSTLEGVEAMWATATDGRKVDFLVNNAGLGSYGMFAKAPWEREMSSIDVNVTALTRLCKLAVPHMLELGQGKILNVASVAGFIPGPGMAVYHATKAYVVSLSVALNEELKGTGISVTAFCPGVTETNFQADAGMDHLEMTGGRIPTAMSVAEAAWGAAAGVRAVVTPGPMNNVFAFLSNLLPRSVLAKLTRRALNR